MPKAQRIPKSARDIAYEVIRNVHDAGTYANVLLPKKLQASGLSREDKALATELTYSALRMEGTLDWVIASFSARPIDEISKQALDLIRLGVYQLLFLDSVPDHAAVNETVEMAKGRFHSGIAGFVNALLRTVTRERERIRWPERDPDPIGYISLRLSYPRWMVELWAETFPLDEVEALCAAMNEAPPLTIRVNRLKMELEALADALRRAGWEVAPGRYFSEALLVRGTGDMTRPSEFKEGHFSVQDESSMLVGHVVDPQPGEAVLDACAAPGGKTTLLGELMGNNGLIIAVDINASRLKLVEEACRRLGIGIVALVEADATKLGEVMKEPVDRVLVDAPCSGLGVLARRPDARWRKSPEQIAELAALQAALLDSAAPFVKPGGVLVYSACTISKAETWDVVEGFLGRNPDFRPSGLEEHLPPPLRADVHDGSIQLLPHRHGTDGMFIARLERS